MPLGTTVTNKVLPSFAGTSSLLGQAFVAGEADWGPEGPTLIKSINEWITTFGPRTATSATMYDWVETYFQTGGRRLYVVRPLNAGAHYAEKIFESAGNKKVLLVKSTYKGTYGNKFKIKITIASSEATVEILTEEGEVLEKWPAFSTRALLLAYAEKHTTYVTMEAEAEENALPKEYAATALTSGANVTSLTEAEKVTGIKLCTATLGPGSVALPGTTGETAHKSLVEWCATTKGLNRRAWLDLADSASAATLITEKWTTAPPLAERSLGAFGSSTCIIPGLTAGTTRKTNGSALFCGLAAQAAAINNMNTATAGPEFPVSPWVLSFTNTFTHAQAEELAESGINTWGEEQGQLCLVSGCFVTALAKESGAEGEIFWSFAATGERMALTYEAEPIMAEALNKRIDGHGHLLAYLEGRLEGLILQHWEKGALYGLFAHEAGVCEVQEPINTLAAEQRGEISAQMQVRITESAQSDALVIISRPITATV